MTYGPILSPLPTSIRVVERALWLSETSLWQPCAYRIPVARLEWPSIRWQDMVCPPMNADWQGPQNRAGESVECGESCECDRGGRGWQPARATCSNNSWNSPFLSLDLCQLKNWCRSEKMHWQMRRQGKTSSSLPSLPDLLPNTAGCSTSLLGAITVARRKDRIELLVGTRAHQGWTLTSIFNSRLSGICTVLAESTLDPI